jgi:ribonucleoside-diphosphate reductase alpha chain
MNDAVYQLLQDRYFRPGETTWEELVDRVVDYLYPDDMIQAKLARTMLGHHHFLPSSPVLMNAGTPVPMMHSCFVLPIADDMGHIMKALSDTVMIQKYGGGVGVNFTPLRKRGSTVSSTNGKASGPVSFMQLWNTAMDVVKQAGKRQGALMGVLNVDHPDIMQFIQTKDTEQTLTNFNLSVGLTKEFMDFITFESETGQWGDARAAAIMTAICKSAWENGEPGVLFLDNINANNPYPEPIQCVNPCGEVPILPYGACCLGSINLNSCLDGHGRLDFEYLWLLTAQAIRFLDRTIEKGEFILPEIEAFEKEYRPLGLGVMGLADVLAKQGIPYGTSEAEAHTRTIFGAMYDAAYNESNGRNTTLLSVAPTGTIAMLAGASYSIEPFFSLAYTKRVEAGTFVHTEPTLRYVLEQQGLDLTDEDKEILGRTGSLQDTSLPDDIKFLFRTATEIPWQQHLGMQAAVQKYVDNAVSKTINLPRDIEWNTIWNIILIAHDLGLKGLTVYRQGSREIEVIDCPNDACDL